VPEWASTDEAPPPELIGQSRAAIRPLPAEIGKFKWVDSDIRVNRA
jgi:hypothetical protein